MGIGEEPGQTVYQATAGHDTFVVLDEVRMEVTLYTTVETLLCPGWEVMEQYTEQPHHYDQETGLLHVLREVTKRSFGQGILSVATARGMIEDMEAEIEGV